MQKFKEPKSVKIWTYLFDVGFDQIAGPLSEIQHTVADREKTRAMLHSIKDFADPTLDDAIFNHSFNAAWGELEQVFKHAKTLTPANQAEPAPQTEQTLLLKEVLRTSVDIKSQVDKLLRKDRIPHTSVIREGQGSFRMVRDARTGKARPVYFGPSIDAHGATEGSSEPFSFDDSKSTSSDADVEGTEDLS